MDDVIRGALAEAVQDRTPSSVDDPGGSANPGNRTVRVRFADGDEAYLKVAVDCDRTRLARAAAALGYASDQLTVTTPEILAADPVADPPYLLTAPLPGTTVAPEWETSSTDERTTILRAVGRALAAIHEPAFDRPGRIVGGDETGLDVEEHPWPDVLAASMDPEEEPEDDAGGEGADRSDEGPERFGDFPERARDAVGEHREELRLGARDGGTTAPPPSLLHGDPRGANCLWNGEDVGFIDWEQAVVGDPVLDVVRAEGHYFGSPEIADRDRLRAALRDGYRDEAGGLPEDFETRRRVYRVVTFLPVASRFDLWAPGVDEPTEELAAWVREEFDRRLDRL